MTGEAAFRSAVDHAVQSCLDGVIPPTIAFMQICMAATDAAAVDTVLVHLAATHTNKRIIELIRLGRRKPDAWRLVHAILDTVSHDNRPGETAGEAVRRYAQSFDRAAAIDPEASVALYALGDAATLAAATGEIAAFLRQGGLIAPDRHWLDIGCGIGRFEAALAPHLASITGIDTSARMVLEALRRCATLANVTIAQSSGLDLAMFADGSFDGVLAVDSFPYLVQPDPALAATHVAESARVLKPGGHLAIFNYSYRGDAEADRRDVERLAEQNGFAAVRLGARDCPSWDGVTFLLRKT